MWESVIVLCFVVSYFMSIQVLQSRELDALLNLSSWLLVSVVWFFLAVPWVCLQFVILVFPDHTHLLFCSRKTVIKLMLYQAYLQRNIELETTLKMPPNVFHSASCMKMGTGKRRQNMRNVFFSIFSHNKFYYPTVTYFRCYETRG